VVGARPLGIFPRASREPSAPRPRLAGVPDLANTLCHYTTAEAAFEHIIPWGELLMNPYARMRDPLENRELSFGGVASGDDTSRRKP
jgi:hypothetical protein